MRCKGVVVVPVEDPSRRAVRRSGRHTPDREPGDRVPRPRWSRGGRSRRAGGGRAAGAGLRDPHAASRRTAASARSPTSPTPDGTTCSARLPAPRRSSATMPASSTPRTAWSDTSSSSSPSCSSRIRRPASPPASHGREARPPRPGGPAPARDLRAERIEDLSQPGQRLRVRSGRAAAGLRPRPGRAGRARSHRDRRAPLRTPAGRCARSSCGRGGATAATRWTCSSSTGSCSTSRRRRWTRIDGGDNRIEGRVIIHPTAEVSSSIILGPTIIGRDARVSNSYIGPYTSIGAGAEIEGAEIERSIIADGARIMHVGGRIEASTVGRSARIFRDFALPRAMRLARRRRRRARAQLSLGATRSCERPCGARVQAARADGPALDRQQLRLRAWRARWCRPWIDDSVRSIRAAISPGVSPTRCRSTITLRWSSGSAWSACSSPRRRSSLDLVALVPGLVDLLARQRPPPAHVVQRDVPGDPQAATT